MTLLVMFRTKKLPTPINSSAESSRRFNRDMQDIVSRVSGDYS